MKKIIVTFLAIVLVNFGSSSLVFGDETGAIDTGPTGAVGGAPVNTSAQDFSGSTSGEVSGENNLNTENIKRSAREGEAEKNDTKKVIQFQDEKFFSVNNNVEQGGLQGVINLMLRMARDMKNVFLVLATIYLLTVVFRIFFAQNSTEESDRLKKALRWTAFGIILMQMSYSIVMTTFNQGVSASVGVSVVQIVIQPIIDLAMFLAAFGFIIAAVLSFYKLITARGDDAQVAEGKMNILYAIVGFILIRVTQRLVGAVYGTTATTCLRSDPTCDAAWPRIREGFEIIVDIVNWANGFIAITTVILIVYAGSLFILSGGDEEKISQGKRVIMYAIIGIIIIVSSYGILQFFIDRNL